MNINTNPHQTKLEAWQIPVSFHEQRSSPPVSAASLYTDPLSPPTLNPAPTSRPPFTLHSRQLTTSLPSQARRRLGKGNPESPIPNPLYGVSPFSYSVPPLSSRQSRPEKSPWFVAKNPPGRTLIHECNSTPSSNTARPMVAGRQAERLE